jgi:hypothetical protein
VYVYISEYEPDDMRMREDNRAVVLALGLTLTLLALNIATYLAVQGVWAGGRPLLLLALISAGLSVWMLAYAFIAPGRSWA